MQISVKHCPHHEGDFCVYELAPGCLNRPILKFKKMLQQHYLFILQHGFLFYFQFGWYWWLRMWNVRKAQSDQGKDLSGLAVCFSEMATRCFRASTRPVSCCQPLAFREGLHSNPWGCAHSLLKPWLFYVWTVSLWGALPKYKWFRLPRYIIATGDLFSFIIFSLPNLDVWGINTTWGK